MKATSKCPKCGSTDIIAGASATTPESYAFWVVSFANPDAMVFKDATRSTVSAWVCRSCGFVEFYADHPSALRGPEKKDPAQD